MTIEKDEEFLARVIREQAEAKAKESGHQRLWGWFGLGRASFLTIPRVMLHAMPDEWQKKMAELLEEYDEAWKWPDDTPDSCEVQAKNKGRYCKWPDWVTDYRHPDREKIESMRATKPPEGF